MTAKILDFVAYRAAHPGGSVRMQIRVDPLWAWRIWLACWGVQ